MSGFSTEKYIAAQGQAIQERLGKYDGRLYLEVGVSDIRWVALVEPLADKTRVSH